MSIEYTVSTPVSLTAGRFSLYEGDIRGSYHIVANCKPTSTDAEYSHAKVGQIDKQSDGVYVVEFHGAPVVFFCASEGNVKTGALEVAAMLFGENVNMVIDVDQNPVRVTSPVYNAAEGYEMTEEAPKPKAKAKAKAAPKAAPKEAPKLTEADLDGATELGMGN